MKLLESMMGRPATDFIKIVESVDAATAKAMLETPDLKPIGIESIAAWLYRLSIWGDVKIVYVNTERGSKKDTITPDQFIKKTTEVNFFKVFGKWELYDVNVNTVEAKREFTSLNKKKYNEIFTISVDFKGKYKELKNLKK